MDRDNVVEAKRRAGNMAAEIVEDGQVIGLGTGSTVAFALERLSERIIGGLRCSGVPTSLQTAQRARALGIPLTTLDDHAVLDIAIDGADQVDAAFRLIKGGGAAQTREKCVADVAGRLVIVVDQSKIVETLSAPVPIEVLPFAVPFVFRCLLGMGGQPMIREGVRKDGPVITDNGNMVIDCGFGEILDPKTLESRIQCLPGVLSCGIFSQYTEKTVVICGEPGQARVLSR
jgi:ribose 5-phosphate isomerase A